MNSREPWPGPLWALHRDPRPPRSGLTRREHRRMRSAMMLGRPLPPRLARAAVEYAPTLRGQAWLGYLLLATGVGWFRAARRAGRAARDGYWPERTGEDG